LLGFRRPTAVAALLLTERSCRASVAARSFAEVRLHRLNLLRVRNFADSCFSINDGERSLWPYFIQIQWPHWLPSRLLGVHRKRPARILQVDSGCSSINIKTRRRAALLTTELHSTGSSISVGARRCAALSTTESVRCGLVSFTYKRPHWLPSTLLGVRSGHMTCSDFAG